MSYDFSLTFDHPQLHSNVNTLRPFFPVRLTLVGNPPAVGSDDEPVKEFTPVGKGGKAMQFTSEGIFKNLQAVQEARGKKVCSIHFAIHCHNLQMPRIRTEPNKSGFLKTP